jgi:hypothetical protein
MDEIDWNDVEPRRLYDHLLALVEQHLDNTTVDVLIHWTEHRFAKEDIRSVYTLLHWFLAGSVPVVGTRVAVATLRSCYRVRQLLEPLYGKLLAETEECLQAIAGYDEMRRRLRGLLPPRPGGAQDPMGPQT